MAIWKRTGWEILSTPKHITLRQNTLVVHRVPPAQNFHRVQAEDLLVAEEPVWAGSCASLIDFATIHPVFGFSLWVSLVSSSQV